MVATVSGIHLSGNHAGRPAANTVPDGSLYSCSDHLKLYKSNYAGNSWADYFSDTGGSAYTPGGTDVAVADGGTGASTASAARSNLGALADTDPITYLDGTVAAAPSTPAAGKLRLYAKTGKVLAVKDDAGAETVLGQGIADQGTVSNYLDYAEVAAPSTPSSGKVRLYAKSDGLLYSKDDAGTETAVSGAGGGGGGGNGALGMIYVSTIAR